jgi:hypothetical protein
MLRLVTGGLVFAGVVSLPLTVAPLHAPRTPQTPTADHSADPRFKALRTFFQRAECPAVQYVREFLDAADRYELDWRLLPSISFVESTGGKAARNNNLFGWDSGRAQFSTPSAGIHEVGYRLTHSALYRDKDLDEVLTTYNPDADYARKVKSVMRQIAPNE